MSKLSYFNVSNDVKCRDCGLPYSDFGVDLVLPDQQWKEIFPEEGGVLCANCISKRVGKSGCTALLAWGDNMTYGKYVTNPR
jgi:hypothetical protein